MLRLCPFCGRNLLVRKADGALASSWLPVSPNRIQLVLSSPEHHSGRAQRAPLENTGEVEAEPTLFVVPGSFPTKATHNVR